MNYPRCLSIIVIGILLAVTAAATVPEDSQSVLADQPTGVGRDDQSDPNWMLRGGCLALKISATLNVFQNEKKMLSIPIPSSATVANTSSCSVLSSDVPSQVITLDWSEQGPSNDRLLVRNISFLFSVDTTSTAPVYGISKVTAMLEFAGSSNNTGLGSHEVEGNFVRMTTGVLDPVKYGVPLNSSLLCDESLTLDMESHLLSSADFGIAYSQKSSLLIKHIQFDAFRPERIPRDLLQAASSCARDTPRDMLPILVGGGLAGVVLIIVCSYVFRKKPTKAKGYSTV